MKGAGTGTGLGPDPGAGVGAGVVPARSARRAAICSLVSVGATACFLLLPIGSSRVISCTRTHSESDPEQGRVLPRSQITISQKFRSVNIRSQRRGGCRCERDRAHPTRTYARVATARTGMTRSREAKFRCNADNPSHAYARGRISTGESPASLSCGRVVVVHLVAAH
jgi:hypothetical protein